MSNVLIVKSRCARQFSHAAVVGCVFVLLLGGCGGKDLLPVSGKIARKDGTPVSGGIVIFEPVAQKASARGEIRADGSFQLGTHGDNDGAAEGEYKVVITPPPPEEGKRVQSTIAQKYQNLESTPLKFTVSKDARKNKFEIFLE